MRKLGLDLGTKTCGIAISDSLNTLASGLSNFQYQNNDLMQIIQKIKRIIIDYNYQIDTFIIGYPTYNLTNQKCKTSLLVDKFIDLLNLHFKEIKIVKQNENYTTMKANDLLNQFDIKASKRKKIIDQVAACVILQAYLDSLNIKSR